MGTASVELRFTTVLKDYKDTDHDRHRKEIEAYTLLPWATPTLMWHGEHWLEMERLTPILDLAPEQSVKYLRPLRDLIQRVHDAGYWHGDVSLVNIVIHPKRGPLLIDWENMVPATGSVSYDLYGARAAGIDPLWPVEGDDGVWWGGPWRTCPGQYWGRS